MVLVSISSELCSLSKEFPVEISIVDLCEKLYQFTGVSPNDMRLIVSETGNGASKEEVYGGRRVQDARLRPFEGYNGVGQVSVVVEDTNVNSIANQLNKMHQEEEEGDSGDNEEHLFKLSEDAYANRKDSVLNWKKEHKLGKFDPQYQLTLNKNRELQNEHLKNLIINERCSVKSTDSAERRGWLRFVGKIPDINNEDVWCGIEFDEPMGKNDGTFKGKKYFGPVKPNYGGFVRPNTVETGSQFTPFENDLDLEFESDDEI
ncbi:hypothetical protein Kpol_1048p3 [Vanderwaltozyma polyspora DSM 70294]|uniref:CAP-Gly domain-containing protein n=1 Tax=Vanderwaltozyma polyspora (strain ATCC 22028 / DSM 70294 / BCRC 21397 / CBS 2163 / NBRC 10782 / NRRL Y-8283 / UCD 57-17) TaxID=436907 RepID=A7TGG6_VANPO|nr:uncharacterized protein Kpol_1048p3 [Vanderwaltozyma polyspora DSM 70294]EDO18573.1 hypothetical protein Kpol_1048p3 [Vanderwaltozyma polyspora DSM 70294]